MFLTPASIVYDISHSRDGTFLTLTMVETRRRLTHDQAAGIDFLPEIFYPVTAPGSRIAKWSTKANPMKASSAMFDAGIRNIDDIDRIQEIKNEQDKEVEAKARAERAAASARELFSRAKASGAFLLPTPITRAVNVKK